MAQLPKRWNRVGCKGTLQGCSISSIEAAWEVQGCEAVQGNQSRSLRIIYHLPRICALLQWSAVFEDETLT